MSASRSDNPAPDAPLGVLRVNMHRDEAIWKLEVMSRRGRLPGFRKTLKGCAVSAHGTPYDRVLFLDAADSGRGGARFATRLELERKMPIIAGILFLATVFPGVLLTDSFMRLHLDFYGAWTNKGLQTWWWYVPLTALSLVWAWFAALAKSRRTAHKSAQETLAKIALELGGAIERPGTPPPAAPVEAARGEAEAAPKTTA